MAAGVEGVFVETDPDPDNARWDGPNSLKPDALQQLLPQLKAIRQALATEAT